jgi:hypothetical protein
MVAKCPPQNVANSPQNVAISPQNATLPPQNTTLPPQNATLPPQNVPAHENVCGKCNESFARSDALRRHKRICKGTCNPLECHKCHQIQSSRSAKSRHLKVCKGVRNVGVVNTIINNNNNNNTTINNNNIINVNVNVLPIGQENIAHLSQEDIMKILLNLKDYSGVRRWLQSVHFNEEVKENNNIRLTNVHTNARTKEKLVVMKTTDGWETTSQTVALQEALKGMSKHLAMKMSEEETKTYFFCREDSDNEGMQRILEIQEFLRHASPNSTWHVKQPFSAMLLRMDQKEMVKVQVYEVAE